MPGCALYTSGIRFVAASCDRHVVSVRGADKAESLDIGSVEFDGADGNGAGGWKELCRGPDEWEPAATEKLAGVEVELGRGILAPAIDDCVAGDVACGG